MAFPAVTAVANVLAHAPGLVCYGSKPVRDLRRDPALLDAVRARLRPYEAAVGYGPNQVYIGNLDPEALRALPRPWFRVPDRRAPSDGPFGDLISEPELLGLMR
ncbi:MAG: glycine reductase, partial [Candidatus Rokubacteria bacterium]|nr:glycine reductase [Candidatus Rokubacteria bacterium]